MGFDFILLINAIATWYMTGVIWLVQAVHYPLFACVGGENSRDYQRRHTRGITPVVGPPMLVEAMTAGLLVALPSPVEARLLWLGAGLVLLIWISTLVLQVPCHTKLEDGFDDVVHRRLVATNWIRTIAWTSRAVLLTWLVWQRMAIADGR